MNIDIQCRHIKDEKQFTKSLQGRKIYKDQCVRCFHEPHNEGGLFVCLKCFNGFCNQDLIVHLSDHQHALYLNIISIPQQQEKKYEITKLAIGKEGGALGDVEYKTDYKVFCGQCKGHIPEGDEFLKPQIQSLINTDSPFKKQSLVSWEVQIHPCEHTITIQQELINKNLDHCSNCELSTNLWLCLTCGNTGCGRKNWDGTGGNSHGINHFETTGHPVVVKLGTITNEGDASVYCYTCNNDVKDNLLQEHLIYLGIEVSSQKKTEKTVAEINLDINLNFALNKLISGKDKTEKRIYEPGFTGMNNIGNSCYLNSVVQILNSLPEYRDQYYKNGHLKSCKRIPAQCFYCQFSKVFWGLNSGKYSEKKQQIRIINQIQSLQEYQQGIKPYDFKLLLAKDNAEFSSSRQQDALEYLQLVFERLEKQEPYIGKTTTHHFDYLSVHQLVCSGCHGFKIIKNKTNQWKFPVPHPTQQDIQAYYNSLEHVDDETKKSKQCQDPEYQVNFESCLNGLRDGDLVSVNCPKCKSEQIFKSRTYFETTPKYLLAIPNRFVVEKWVPKKLNALINIYQKIDISEFLIQNVKVQGEMLIDQKKQEGKKYSEENVIMITTMGFSQNSAKRALIKFKDNVEAASNWLFENMDDPSIHAPIQQNTSKPQSIDQGALLQVMDLGFDENQSKIALINSKGDPNAAIQWLFNVNGQVSQFSHLLQNLAPKQQKIEYQQPKHTQYELTGVIVHLGKSVHSGHYVAYVRNGEEWVLFNDQKVTSTREPFLGKGYIYVYSAK